MARRILSITFASVLTACQVGPIEVVECATNADCGAAHFCELPSHRCVKFDQSEPSAVDSTELNWNDRGQVLRRDNRLGIAGAWWLHDDCPAATSAIADGQLICPAGWTTPSCCTEYDPSLVGPAPENHPGLRIAAGTDQAPASICIKGTLTRVLTDESGQARYDVGFGAILELPLADDLAFDATRAFPGGPIIGFQLNIDGASMGSRVRVGIRGAANEAYFVEVPVPTQDARVLFSEVEQGDWVMPRVPLDTTALQGLHVSLEPSAEEAPSFDFCLGHLRALQRPAATQ